MRFCVSQCWYVYGVVCLRLYSRVLPVFGLAGNRRAGPSHALRSSQKWSVNNQRVTHVCKHLAHLKQVWGFIGILFFFSLKEKKVSYIDKAAWNHQ